MKIGVVLPTFRWSPEEALDVAAAAERSGLDGVFAYDHLWPMGNPERPAIAPFPLLATVARRHPGLIVGPLVARIGLVDDEVLVEQFLGLEAVAPGRVIVALGTGDKLSSAENEAYGIEFAPAAQRRESLARVASEIRERKIPVWIGGGARPTVELAETLGCAVNMWGASREAAAEQATRSEVTWAGLLDAEDERAATDALEAVAEAGATWAVVGWPASLNVLARVSGR